MLESDIDPGYIHWTLAPFQLEKFQLKVSQYVCYIIWETIIWETAETDSVVYSYRWINMKPKCWAQNFFRIRFVKRLRPAEKFIFQIM